MRYGSEIAAAWHQVEAIDHQMAMKTLKSINGGRAFYIRKLFAPFVSGHDDSPQRENNRSLQLKGYVHCNARRSKQTAIKLSGISISHARYEVTDCALLM